MLAGQSRDSLLFGHGVVLAVPEWLTRMVCRFGGNPPVNTATILEQVTLSLTLRGGLGSPEISGETPRLP